jgi:hypothetical protein
MGCEFLKNLSGQRRRLVLGHSAMLYDPTDAWKVTIWKPMLLTQFQNEQLGKQTSELEQQLAAWEERGLPICFFSAP